MTWELPADGGASEGEALTGQRARREALDTKGGGGGQHEAISNAGEERDGVGRWRTEVQ